MITQKDLNKVSKKFEREEGRAPFMDMAKKLLKEGKRDEAVLLILSTWNFASFRYVITKFDINNFREVLNKTEKKLEKINKNFENINFENEEYKKEIIELFNYLSNEQITEKKDTSKFKSIGPTGASKVLYLLKPEVFIMWDSYIRREYPIRNYSNKISKLYSPILNKKNDYPNYPKTGESYYNFLSDMKKLFIESKLTKPLRKNGKEKDWTKIIDEFNYINLSVEIGKKLREK